jgi:hypothetical protein
MSEQRLFAVVLAGVLATLAIPNPAGAQSVYPPDVPLSLVLQPPAVPLPSYLVPTAQPEFNTVITRIADDAALGSPFETCSQQFDYDLRHAYSLNQPWNADGSLIMLGFTTPAAILDGTTYKFLRWTWQPSEAVWSNLDPMKIFGTIEGSNGRPTNEFYWADASYGTNNCATANAPGNSKYQLLRKFSDYDSIDFGNGKGNLSVDDRYAAIFGFRPGGRVDLIVYDIIDDSIVSTKNLGNVTLGSGLSGATINSATMSPSGNYVVITYNAGGSGTNQGVVVYDARNLTNPRNLAGDNSHFDVCTAADGHEAIVIQAPNSTQPNGNATSTELYAVSLSNGAQTPLLPAAAPLLPAAALNYDIHVSCRNTRRPGWAYISEFANDGENAGVPGYQSTFAVALDGSGRVERFAHEHHASYSPSWSPEDNYRRAPMAVPNQAGARVIFASDWENADPTTAPVYAYVASAACPPGSYREGDRCVPTPAWNPACPSTCINGCYVFKVNEPPICKP